MIRIRFADVDAEELGLGWLAGRFSFTAVEDGALIPEEAVEPLRKAGLKFEIVRAATYGEKIEAFRSAAAPALQ